MPSRDFLTRAACSDRSQWGLADPFYPGQGQTFDRAREICGGCEVLTRCGKDALEWERREIALKGPVTGAPQGFVGGMTPAERIELLKGEQVVSEKPNVALNVALREFVEAHGKAYEMDWSDWEDMPEGWTEDCYA